MKTKEEILKELWPELQLGGQISKLIFEAMQLYSDQQNKELREENEKLKSTISDFDNSHDKYAVENLKAEIQRLTNSYNTCAENFSALQVRFGEEAAKVNSLTKEVEELKQSKEQRIVELTSVGMGKQQEIDDAKVFIKNLQCRINELQRVLGWSDMEPHHPIGSQLGYGKINKEQPDWDKLSKIEPPTDNLNNKAWRGAWLEGQMVGYAKGQLELTRLWELLERINKVAGNDLNRYYAGLSKDIDNALNHKP